MGNKVEGMTTRYPTETWPDWMESLPDTTMLSALSIPGTHGSVNSYGMHVECQSWPLYSQLEAGIRFIDIGCRHWGNRLTLHQSVFFQFGMLSHVMDDVVEYLKKFGSEVVLLRIREEGITQDNSRSIGDTLADKLYHYSSFIYEGKTLSALKIGQVRGKIVLLHDFDMTLGIPYSSMQIANSSDARDLSDLRIGAKWDKIQNNLAKSSQGEATDMFLTICGGNCGPHQSGPPNPYDVAVKINGRLDKFLSALRERKQRLGIIAMNFPNCDLIKTIIETNELK
ncbi:1-phosphatidylinositol phosphodiesterase-like [Glandiceps talaboti]